MARSEGFGSEKIVVLASERSESVDQRTQRGNDEDERGL